MVLRNTKPFVVWRRHPDGYVDATVGAPIDWPGIRFDVLLTTREWPEARDRIEAERVLGNEQIAELLARETKRRIA